MSEAKASSSTEHRADGQLRQPMTWAQCETCDRWRKLPDLTEDQVPDEWYCRMNLDPLHNACDLPEEQELETREAEEEGGLKHWLGPPQPG